VNDSYPKSSDIKKVTKTATEPGSSFSNPDNQSPHSNRPLDDIVKWYAILEERQQEFDWGHVDDTPVPTETPKSRPPSLRAGRQKVSPAPLETQSTAEATVDEYPPVSHRQNTAVETSSQDNDAEEWKQKILELVQKSKRLSDKIDSQSEESVPPKKAAILDTVPFPLESVDPQTDRQPPASCDLGPPTDSSNILGESALSIVDSGGFVGYATANQGEYVKGWSHREDLTTVDSRTVDAYESSLREAMETFETVVRSMAHSRPVPESKDSKPNAGMSSPDSAALTSPLSNESEIHVQPKREAEQNSSGQIRAARDTEAPEPTERFTLFATCCCLGGDGFAGSNKASHTLATHSNGRISSTANRSRESPPGKVRHQCR
jgi:hypothetical protein